MWWTEFTIQLNKGFGLIMQCGHFRGKITGTMNLLNTANSNKNCISKNTTRSRSISAINEIFFYLHKFSSQITSLMFYPLVSRNTKGQLISKCIFGVFNSPKKTNENNSTWVTMAVKSNFLFVFWENWRYQKTFRN